MTTTPNIQPVIENYLNRQEEQVVLQQMVWFPQSPHLSVMESVWDFTGLHQEEAAETQKSTEELWQLLKDAGTTYLPTT